MKQAAAINLASMAVGGQTHGLGKTYVDHAANAKTKSKVAWQLTKDVASNTPPTPALGQQVISPNKAAKPVGKVPTPAQEQSTPADHLSAKFAHDDASEAHSIALHHAPSQPMRDFHSQQIRDHKQQSDWHSNQLLKSANGLTAGGPGSGRTPYGRHPFDEDPTHPEARKAMKLLKQHGYHGFGRTAAATRTYSRSKPYNMTKHGPGVADAHQVTINRYNGKWDSGSIANPEDRITPASGNSSASLAQHLSSINLPDTYKG